MVLSQSQKPKTYSHIYGGSTILITSEKPDSRADYLYVAQFQNGGTQGFGATEIGAIVDLFRAARDFAFYADRRTSG